jgi:hypothetical protein
MTRTLILAAGLLAASAGAAAAQSTPDYTGNLNASPPASRPVAAPPTTQAAAPPTTQAASPPTATTQAPVRVEPAPAPSTGTPVASAAPIQTQTQTQTPASAPAAPPAAAPAAPRALTRAEIDALPFTVSLPEGYVLTAGRPGPDFQVWTVRKNGLAQLMIYAGPASQFPIHSGEMVQAGGRTTVVVTEEGRRRALEHLFQQSTAPNHIHVWVASLDGPDRDRAEALAHGVSPR